MFDYELHWLENNPLIKQLTTIQQKNRIIIYKCSKCNYTINNNRQYFLNHIDHQHPEILQDIQKIVAVKQNTKYRNKT
ncbi:unnamed protein product [Rotaria sordida]|uniref:Uncharacterized protein n=1 Tax=Rotaria sordida TaxID=392033 RepID=A0A816F8N2_9BILA|nr:unnamed protein product [Rotaria sordida]CAF1656535.1 unnamed protein product [Rotaria sordida]